MLLRCLAAALGGLFLSIGFEPVGFSPALPLGVTVLLLSVRGCRLGLAWIPGWIFGLGFFGAHLWWLRAVGTDAWAMLSLAQSVYFMPLGAALAVLTRLRWWPVWSACAWVAVETWRGSWPFGGLTWGRLSFGTADTVWAAALPWLGMTGVSLLIALTGATLAWLLTGNWRRPLVAGAAVAGVVATTAVPTIVGYDVAPGRTLSVAAVQSGVPGDGTDVLAHHREITQRFSQMTVDLAQSDQRPDLVVWSENSTATDPFSDTQTRSAIDRASAAIGVPILVGAMVDSPREKEVLNQGIVWQPQLGAGDRYTKRHPVAYGEYIPFRGSFIPDTYGQLRLIQRDLARGTSLEPLRIGGIRVADAICFDVSYDDAIHGQVAHGGQLIAVQTSNALFINTAQVDQQFEISRLRAIETGRYVVVAAINGVSGVIGPDGEILAMAEPRATAVAVADVTLADEITPAVAMGEWPGRILEAVSVVALVVALLTYRRRARDDRTRRTARLQPSESG